MPDATVHHATFTLTRDLDAAPERVWGAFAREDLKARWFGAHDIVDGVRILYVCDMFVSGWKMSVSLATIEVEARGSRTRLTITEQ